MKTRNPLVSIGMPVYNGEKYLRLALDSLLSQDYDNFELIISDNASTDHTADLCLEYHKKDRRIRVYQNDTNNGPGYNFNRVFHLSSGEYFMWAANDDLWDKSYISKCVDMLKENPSAVMCCTDIQCIDSTGKFTSHRKLVTFSPNMSATEQVSTLTQWTGWLSIYSLIRTEALRKTRLCFQPMLGGDILLLFELCLLGPFARVPEFLFYYRIFPEKTMEDIWKSLNPGNINIPYSEQSVKPYTNLAVEIYKLMINSPLNITSKISDTFLKTISKDHDWQNLITRENPDSHIDINHTDREETVHSIILSTIQAKTTVTYESDNYDPKSKTDHRLQQSALPDSSINPQPKIYVTADRKVFYGSEAEKLFNQNNDIQYLTADGVVKVNKERWRIAQEYEKQTWLADQRNSNDDRNFEHKERFDNFKVLQESIFENALELGCGPFTNLRLIVPLLKARPKVTLLDPLIEDYKQHPNCAYKDNLLCGIPVTTLHIPIEDFVPIEQYDLIVMSNVLEHCYDITKIFKTIISCLKPSGIFVFADNMFKKEDIESVVANLYDAGHPLRVTENLIESFLQENFTELYSKKFHGLYEQQNRIDLYYIGKREFTNTQTLHFVYAGNPHNDASIRAPETITNNLFRFFEKWIKVKYYDLADTSTPIDVKPNDVMIGHPHPGPNTAIRRLFKKPCSGKFLLWPFHTLIPEINRYAKDVAEQADKLFTISGPYWIDTIEDTEYAGWKNKIVRLDNAIDSEKFSLMKKDFNPPGKRGLFIFGRSGVEKGTFELFTLLNKIPAPIVVAGGYSEDDLRLIRQRPETIILGHIDWRDTQTTRLIMEKCDFFVNMSVSDASPTTLLESMALGLIPITTPQCGYYYPSFLLLSLTDLRHNLSTLKVAQTLGVEELKSRQVRNRQIIEQIHNWGNFRQTIWNEIKPYLSRKETHPKNPQNIKIAGDFDQGKGLAKVGTNSEFAENIDKIIADVRPLKIIETGTYLGTGTTQVIAKALQENNLVNSKFYSIEVNPNNYKHATANLRESRLLDFVEILNGLSIPRNMLPTIEEIENKCVKNVEFDDIFVDHKEHERALLYYRETNFDSLPDDLLEKCLEKFDYRPDFVLLDSGGHIGNIEFNYLISHIKGNCYIALDDIYHIKHHKSFLQMQNDARFTVIVSSDEKFGFCIAKFTPPNEPLTTQIKNILWLRTDSIGDNVLSSSMLPHVKNIYKGATITVVCQEHIAELYDSCPFVDRIIKVPSELRWQDKEDYRLVLHEIRQTNPDILMNSTFSIHELADLPGLEFIPKRFAFRNAPCATYTDLIPATGRWKPELDRHRDFLTGLGINSPLLQPVVWLSKADEEFADDFFRRNNLHPLRSVAVFVGARTSHRYYDPERYANLLNDMVSRHNLAIVLLGGYRDKDINRELSAGLKSPVIDLAGKTTIRQMAAVIKRSRLYLGTETSAAHIACAVGTPNVVLLGGGHFGRFMPYSSLTSVVCLPLECYGCDWQCKYPRVHCVRDILPEVFSAAIQTSLEKPSNRPRIFVQGESLWNPDVNQPKWHWFTKLIDIKSVEIVPIGEMPELAKSDQKQYIPTHNPPTKKQVKIAGKREYPKISIVTPSFNQGQFLEECIDSILSQNYPNLEYIIMDGGSTDNSVDIIKKYEKYLTYWQSKPDNGQYFAINEGFGKSTGEIMTWLNSDDILHPKSLDTVSEILSRFREIEWIMGRPNGIDEKGKQSWMLGFLPLWSREKYLKRQYKHPYIQQEGTFWKRTLWERAGACIDTTYKLAADMELWARFFRFSLLNSVDALLGAFRKHSAQKTATFLEEYNREAERIIDREIEFHERGSDKALLPAPPPVKTDQPSPVTDRTETVVMSGAADDKSSVRVSAIVSTYNSERFIRGCLADLVNQTLYQKGELEIVVVNSGSEQNEEAVVREFQNRYKNILYLRTQERETVYAAWNRGIKAASGRYITNANTDDRHRQDALELMADTLDQKPGISLVYADVIISETENETFEKHTPAGHFQWLDFDREKLSVGCYIGPQPMWRKSLHDRYGYFNEAFTSSGDWEFWLRIAGGADFLHVPEFLGLYLRSRDSLEHMNTGQRMEEDRTIYRTYIPVYLPAYEEYFTGRPTGLADPVNAYRYGQILAALGKYDEAIKLYEAYLRKHPDDKGFPYLLQDMKTLKALHVAPQTGPAAALPAFVMDYINEADAHIAKGDLALAREAIHQAINHASGHPQLCGMLSNMLENLQSPEAAAEFLGTKKKDG
jgi:glycosyltransferase involved in cell wall biosynthesis/ADP-heptose:LPS heptosyltransferase/SAM-dependent methyltransferase/predicted O-methyltransferase YrrM